MIKHEQNVTFLHSYILVKTKRRSTKLHGLSCQYWPLFMVCHALTLFLLPNADTLVANMAHLWFAKNCYTLLFWIWRDRLMLAEVFTKCHNLNVVIILFLSLPTCRHETKYVLLLSVLLNTLLNIALIRSGYSSTQDFRSLHCVCKRGMTTDIIWNSVSYHIWS